MKRRSRSSPPATKRPFTEPGTPGPFTSDLARDQRQREFPGASPNSTKKSAALRKQLFHTSHMVVTRAGTSATMTSSGSTSSLPPAIQHCTPPGQDNDLSVEELPRFPDLDQAPRAQPQRRERDPPDVQDVLTQQTEVLAGMLAELRARQGQPYQQPHGAEAVADPNFDWTRLILPSETSFQVPNEGQVQRMASSLLARVPTLAGRDQHEARFVLQMMSIWPDMDDQERFMVFQRLNVYCIVAARGWPAATAACASTGAADDFVLPPGVVLPPQAAPRRPRRNNYAADQQPPQAQYQQPPPAPAPPRQQQQQQQRPPRARRNNNQRGRGGAARN